MESVFFRLPFCGIYAYDMTKLIIDQKSELNIQFHYQNDLEFCFVFVKYFVQ